VLRKKQKQIDFEYIANLPTFGLHVRSLWAVYRVINGFTGWSVCRRRTTGGEEVKPKPECLLVKILFCMATRSYTTL
jgi:hypothetical protein